MRTPSARWASLGKLGIKWARCWRPLRQPRYTSKESPSAPILTFQPPSCLSQPNAPFPDGGTMLPMSVGMFRAYLVFGLIWIGLGIS